MLLGQIFKTLKIYFKQKITKKLFKLQNVKSDSKDGDGEEEGDGADGGPLSKKSAIDKKVQDKKKEKILKEKKRTLKRL